MDDSDLLFKYYDSSVKEEKEAKKIKEEQIFPKSTSTQKIKKFTSLKQKIAKEALNLEIDTPVFVCSIGQYGVIRKVIRNALGEGDKKNKGKEEQSV